MKYRYAKKDDVYIDRSDGYMWDREAISPEWTSYGSFNYDFETARIPDTLLRLLGVPLE
jgi:hypothetical protein